MKTLSIFVCENFAPEFTEVVRREHYDDVFVTPYACMCESKKNKASCAQLIQDCIASTDDGLIFCSKQCDILGLVPEESSFRIIKTNYCVNHLASEDFIEYILHQGGYIIGRGWLNNWERHLENAGFDRDTARCFYQDFCKELVFFDANIDTDVESKLQELSRFLDLPYVSIPIELETLTLLLRSAVYEWRLHKSKDENTESHAEMQARCAEYSAILDLIGRIATYTSKRATIDKIKEIFVSLFGSQEFTYWDGEAKDHDMPDEIKTLFSDSESLYLNKQENGFLIKVQQNDTIYGVIDVSNFLFPQYLEKYLNFAIEISKVCGLVLSNIKQYENIRKSEKDLHYLSFHDALTGLYNRAYINELIQTQADERQHTVFIFDIDKLKYTNDTFGHLEGDKLIQSVASVLKHCFREKDTVARIGGDEFMAIQAESHLERALSISERIQSAIASHNQNEPKDHLKMSVSYGFAVSQTKDDTIAVLMQQADQRMYANKMDKQANS